MKEERILAVDAKEAIGKEITFGGWIHDIRDMGGLRFLALKDRTGQLQVTLHKKSVDEKVFASSDGLTKESSLLVKGKIQAAEKAPNGVELVPSSITILNKALAPTPIDTSGKINTDLSKRLDYRFLDLRDHKRLMLFKMRSKMYRALIEFFDDAGFTSIQTPKLTSSGVESGAELFPVEYFKQKGFLSQSPQIYKQMMVIAGFEKVYELGPVFRAEKSLTTRHLTEFTGVDFEMGFIDSHHDVMDVIEAMITSVLTFMKKNCAEELKAFDITIKIPKKIPRISMHEAKKILKEDFKKELPEEDDLDPEAERMLAEYAQKHFDEEFIFVTEYPFTKRPFYHMKPDKDPKSTKSFDLLWNGVEVCTGAQREHRYAVLKKQAEEKGLDLDSMEDYANIFKYGSIPHGGVGFGLDRMVQRLLKLDNIKEAVLLPRDPERLTP